jgi:hypothetical protein
VVKLKKKNNYQDLPWNNTIEEDTFRYPDLFAGEKGINVWPMNTYKNITLLRPANYGPNLKEQLDVYIYSLV